MEVLEELRMHGGDFDTRRRRSICNVAWMPPKFAPIVPTMGPPPVRMLMTTAARGVPVQGARSERQRHRAIELKPAIKGRNPGMFMAP